MSNNLLRIIRDYYNLFLSQNKREIKEKKKI